MIVSDLRSASLEDGVELSARVAFERTPDEPRRVWFRFGGPVPPLPVTGDPFLAGLVVPCMMLHEDLRIEAPVSPSLLDAILGRTVPLLRSWQPGFAAPSIRAAGFHALPLTDQARGVGACFSSGVDSSYTLEKNRDRITHLLTIAGFDRSVDDERLWRNVVARAVEASDELGKTLVTASINLKDVGRSEAQRRARRAGPLPAKYYATLYHGSVLVAVGQCLQHVIGELIVPASHSWDSLVPWGSHPELDRSWSSRGLVIDHDGCEADRIEKVRKLGAWNPDRVRRLLVCQDTSRSGLRNCSRCRKCLLTLMVLRIDGLSHLADSFAEPLDLGRVARLEIERLDRNRFLRLRRAAAASGDRPLAAALEAALGWRARVRRRLRAWRAARAQLGG